MRRFIAIALFATAAIGMSTTDALAGFGLFHRGAGCCDAAPACDAAPSCGCEAPVVAAPSCGCEAPVADCCSPRPHLLKGLFGRLHSKLHAQSACCEAPAPSCGCEAPAPSCGCEAPVMEPTCAAPAPSCCDAAPSCGCEAPAPTCCKPHGAKIKALFGKIKCHMKSKMKPVSCGCEAPAPSCGCEAPVAPSCGCGA